MVAALVSAALVFPTVAAAQDGDKKVIEMWTHSAGNPAELAVYDQIIADFNASQDEYEVQYTSFPQLDYNTSVISASQGGLPCLLDVDGPNTPAWAWSGILQPLDLPQEVVDTILPSATGYWNDQLYSIGYWDAAVANYARKSVLEENGIRIPTLEEPWTLDEFDAALETLQATGDFDYAWDIGMRDQGEAVSDAFSPFLQSFGGDLIDRSTDLTAEGVLNGPEAVAFGEWFQSLFERGLVPGPSQTQAEQEAGFIDGNYAIQWNGNWRAVPTIDGMEANGESVDDLLFLPAPDFGHGPKIGAGSWHGGDARLPLSRGRQRVPRVLAPAPVPRRVRQHHWPVPGQCSGARHDRDVPGRRPAGGLLRPVAGAGGHPLADARLHQHRADLHQRDAGHRQWCRRADHPRCGRRRDRRRHRGQ